MKWWYAIPLLITVIGMVAFTMMPATAIVKATVIRIADTSPRFQLIMNATKAFPNFPLFTMSNCPHEVGESLFIGVKVANGWGSLPVWDEAELFKEQGIGFVSWNGCD